MLFTRLKTTAVMMTINGHTNVYKTSVHLSPPPFFSRVRVGKVYMRVYDYLPAKSYQTSAEDLAGCHFT
jgi:hypothetical protein